MFSLQKLKISSAPRLRIVSEANAPLLTTKWELFSNIPIPFETILDNLILLIFFLYSPAEKQCNCVSFASWWQGILFCPVSHAVASSRLTLKRQFQKDQLILRCIIHKPSLRFNLLVSVKYFGMTRVQYKFLATELRYLKHTPPLPEPLPQLQVCKPTGAQRNTCICPLPTTSPMVTAGVTALLD